MLFGYSTAVQACFFSSLFLPFSLKNAVQVCGEELQHLICCESHPRWLCVLTRTGPGRAAQRPGPEPPRLYLQHRAGREELLVQAKYLTHLLQILDKTLFFFFLPNKKRLTRLLG